MKYIIVLGDGMADEPIESLGNLTPLQAANTPHMDWLVRTGRSGMLDTVPKGIHPGSEVANLSVLGYDVAKVLEGRGVLEAAGMGVEVLSGEMAMRCNLICIEDEKIKNHSAGHITTEEARILIEYMNETLSDDQLQFFPGVSYRHMLKLKGGDKRLHCTPPHDVQGAAFEPVMIRADSSEARDTAEYLNRLIFRSRELLENHPVNRKRRAEGKDPANAVWPWSPGYKPQMEHLSNLFPIKSGAVISAVDLINGIGIYAGLEVIKVAGATGLYNTDYAGKARAALNALKEKDFVYLHIEAPDEAGHEGDPKLKIRTIEDIDRLVVKTILDETENFGEPVTVALLPDHPTPCRLKTHTGDPVPFVIRKPGRPTDGVKTYDEFAAQKGGYGLLKGKEFIEEFFR